MKHLLIRRWCQRASKVLVVAAFVAAGCTGTPPTGPSFTPPPVTPPGVLPSNTWTVSGTVFVHQLNGVTPATSGQVFGWVEQERSGHTTGRIPIGPDGRYQFFVSQITSRVHVMGPSHQPCVASRAITGDVTMDIHHVADSRLLGGNLPPELMAQQPTLSGIVYEQTAEGRRPLPNVHVELDGLDGLGVVIATTLTDADGKYVFCGVPPIRGLVLLAGLTGYQLFYSTGDLMGVTTLDIEMRREGQ